MQTHWAHPTVFWEFYNDVRLGIRPTLWLPSMASSHELLSLHWFETKKGMRTMLNVMSVICTINDYLIIILRSQINFVITQIIEPFVWTDRHLNVMEMHGTNEISTDVVG